MGEFANEQRDGEVRERTEFFFVQSFLMIVLITVTRTSRTLFR